MNQWKSLAFRTGVADFPGKVCREHLNLTFTLTNGQTFGWRRTDPFEENIWTGVVGNHVAQLRQLDDDVGTVEFRCASSNSSDVSEIVEDALYDYFHLHTCMSPMMSRWRNATLKFEHLFKSLRGMRIVRQDPTECLFSFICSSNNHISRIEKMVNTLRQQYGSEIDTLEPITVRGEPLKFFVFPSIDSLVAAKEEDLRALGFGYRAKFIVKTAHLLHNKPGGGERWLLELREQPCREGVQTALTELHGVGRKVADCVALFSLDQRECIPVDTHVFQIAQREFDKSLRGKSVTPVVYNKVGDLFRGTFGEGSGWAHQILFAAELPQFQEVILPGKKGDANSAEGKTGKKKTKGRTKPGVGTDGTKKKYGKALENEFANTKKENGNTLKQSLKGLKPVLADAKVKKEVISDCEKTVYTAKKRPRTVHTMPRTKSVRRSPRERK